MNKCWNTFSFSPQLSGHVHSQTDACWAELLKSFSCAFWIKAKQYLYRVDGSRDEHTPTFVSIKLFQIFTWLLMEALLSSFISAKKVDTLLLLCLNCSQSSFLIVEELETIKNRLWSPLLKRENVHFSGKNVYRSAEWKWTQAYVVQTDFIGKE